MIESLRFRSTYLVSQTNPWPHAVRERLDGIAGRELPRALSNAMQQWADSQADSSIWMLRRLHFHADLDLQRENATLAGEWAAQFVAALRKRLDEDPSNDDSIRFADEAELLKSFVLDAALSRADKWYYSRFDGLKALSTTAQIRTALCSKSSEGLEALIRMTTQQLQQTIGALSENDAGRIWDTLSTLMPPACIAESLPELRSTWIAEGRFAPDGAGELRWALHMAIVMLRQAPRDGRAWAQAAQPVGRMIRIFRTLSRVDCGIILDALETSRRDDLYRVLTGTDVRAIEPLLGTPRRALEDFLEQRPAEAQEVPERRYTPFGGIFLLLPFLDALAVPITIRSPQLYRLWILLKCLGGERAIRVFEDPLIREVLQLDQELSGESFCKWQRGIRIAGLRRARQLHMTSDLIRDNSSHRTSIDRRYLRLPRLLSASVGRDRWLDDSALLVLRSLAWRLPGFSTASLPHLFANFLDFPASVEEHIDRRVVRLGTPPLQVLLNMTGICRWRYPITWLDNKRFELYPEAP